MNNARTAVKRYIAVTGDEPGLVVVLVLNVREKGLVLCIFKVFTDVLGNNLVFAFFKQTADECLCKDVAAVLSLDFYVLSIGVYAKGNV